MKRVLVLEGSGFSEPQETIKIFENQGFKAERFFVPQNPDLMPEWPAVDYVILRGPWRMGISEVLNVKSLVHRCQKPLLKILEDRSSKTKVVGLGRGALVLFSMLAGKASPFSDWKWEKILEDEGLWVDAQIGDSPSLIKALLYERYRPELLGPVMLQMESWVKINEDSMGWHLNHRAFLSLVDIFAFQDRAQHADFGYTDLSQLSMPQDVFSAMFPGG